MVKIKEKKEIKATRDANELNVENNYGELENRKLEKEESDLLSKGLNELDKLWMSNMENEGRNYFYKDEVVALLNSLIK